MQEDLKVIDLALQPCTMTIINEFRFKAESLKRPNTRIPRSILCFESFKKDLLVLSALREVTDHSHVFPLDVHRQVFVLVLVVCNHPIRREPQEHA